MTPDGFFPYVLPDVPGCPDPVVKLALVAAAHEFCRETLCWTEIQDPMPLVAGTSDYEIDMPSQALALTVRDVWLGTSRLAPVTMQALQRVMPDWRTASSSEPVYYNAAVERGSIRVFPIPTNPAGLALVVRASYAPSMGANALPDFLGQRYMEVIAAGAKARLLIVPGTEWANAPLAGYYRQLFDAAITNARIEEAHDRVPGSVSVQPRRFA